MAIFFVKGKGWRYTFHVNKVQYSRAYFKTKSEAKRTQLAHKEMVLNPPPPVPAQEEKTPITFGELVDKRLDYVKAHNTKIYYCDYVYMARRWVEKWDEIPCENITRSMIEEFILDRSLVSNHAANRDLRYLKAVFGWGVDQELILENPTARVKKLPVEKKRKYIPPKEDVLKVLMAADSDKRDYLYMILDTVARMGEINKLTWDDVHFEDRTITLYTRKKRGGHLTGRNVAMTKRVYDILSRRYKSRDKKKPWVFWQTYWSSKTGEKVEGPYIDRKRILRTLCQKAGVPYFRFHALRHFGASMMKHKGVPTGAIQKILGHEKISTTDIYLQAIEESEREAIEVLERELEVDERERSPSSVENLKTAHKDRKG
jgi:integrase